MKCTKCGNEMKKGYLHSDALLQWIPEGERPPILAFSKAKNGALLNNFEEGVLCTAYKAEAYYCHNCGIVVAPVDKSICPDQDIPE